MKKLVFLSLISVISGNVFAINYCTSSPSYPCAPRGKGLCCHSSKLGDCYALNGGGSGGNACFSLANDPVLGDKPVVSRPKLETMRNGTNTGGAVTPTLSDTSIRSKNK